MPAWQMRCRAFIASDREIMGSRKNAGSQNFLRKFDFECNVISFFASYSIDGFFIPKKAEVCKKFTMN